MDEHDHRGDEGGPAPGPAPAGRQQGRCVVVLCVGWGSVMLWVLCVAVGNCCDVCAEGLERHSRWPYSNRFQPLPMLCLSYHPNAYFRTCTHICRFAPYRVAGGGVSKRSARGPAPAGRKWGHDLFDPNQTAAAAAGDGDVAAGGEGMLE